MMGNGVRHDGTLHRLVDDTRVAPVSGLIGWIVLIAAVITLGTAGVRLIDNWLDGAPEWPPLVDIEFSGFIEDGYLHYTFSHRKVVPYTLHVVTASWQRIDGVLENADILEPDGTVTVGEAVLQEGETITASFRATVPDWLLREGVGDFRYCWSYHVPVDEIRTFCHATPLSAFEIR